MPAITPEIMKDLAPTGRLRASINLGNAVLAQGTPEDPRGVSVELARELARRAGLPLDLVTFPAAAPSFDTVKSGRADVGFLAREQARAAEVDFTAPYVLIEGTYLVLKDSPLQSVADVDRSGIRIAVGPGSAYDHFLTRTLKHAQIVRAHIGGGTANIELFLRDRLEAAAGVKQALQAWAAKDSSVRVMDGRFQVIEQAMALPKGRPLAAAYLKAFVEEMKASGFVADGLKRSGQLDAAVAPPE